MLISFFKGSINAACEGMSCLLAFSPIRYRYTKDLSFLSSLYPLGVLYAISQATIDKSHFGYWVNLDKLAIDFPQRVTLIGSTVKLKGPVFIIPSRFFPIITKIALSTIVGLAGAAVAAIITEFIWTSISKDTSPEISSVSKVVAFFTFVCATPFTWIKLLKFIPIERGIHFL